MRAAHGSSRVTCCPGKPTICATALLKQEIAAQGLAEWHAVALARRIGYDKTPAGAFRLITATPRERCDAALVVIERMT